MKCKGCEENTEDQDGICVDCRLDVEYGWKKPEEVGLKLVITQVKGKKNVSKR